MSDEREVPFAEAAEGPPPEVARTLLALAEGRRQAIDQMMWQVPGLSLLAQSFLLTIALGHASPGARAVSGALALVACLATTQLLLKHRFHEREWSQWLEHFSRARNWQLMHDRQSSASIAWPDSPDHRHAWHREPRDPSVLALLLWRARSRLVEPPSPYVWIVALLVFAAADLGAAVLGLVELAGG